MEIHAHLISIEGNQILLSRFHQTCANKVCTILLFNFTTMALIASACVLEMDKHLKSDVRHTLNVRSHDAE
ncbi:hypothetical protein M8C21_001656 [Ambrosia artemisiifolia]|uniref:Uncharacterized protein n=1 Tax=Ambrosia artemisiifolia TaxID=4212 RepID=A0AAD5C1Y4_AMBAR|nr:hypothetical protein M8C21_001656 [Ambrosia artemisiifolia]